MGCEVCEVWYEGVGQVGVWCILKFEPNCWPVLMLVSSCLGEYQQMLKLSQEELKDLVSGVE